jgi:hypothetical protein
MEISWRLLHNLLLPYMRAGCDSNNHQQHHSFQADRNKKMTPVIKKVPINKVEVPLTKQMNDYENYPNDEESQQQQQSLQEKGKKSDFQYENPMKSPESQQPIRNSVSFFEQDGDLNRNQPNNSHLPKLNPNAVVMQMNLNEDIIPKEKKQFLNNFFSPQKYFPDTPEPTATNQRANGNGNSDEESSPIKTNSDLDEGDEDAEELRGDEDADGVNQRGNQSNNLNRFYSDYSEWKHQLDSDDENNNDNEDHPRRSEESKENRQRPHRGSYHSSAGEESAVQDDNQEEEQSEAASDENEDYGYAQSSVSRRGKPIFQAHSSYSYDVEYYHLHNHLFLLRLFALAVCFGTSGPAVFFVLALVFFFEIKVQLWQVLFYFPRNLPAISNQVSEVWIVFYDLVVILSIITNASMILFNIDARYSQWDFLYQLLLWIGIVGFLLAFFMLCYYSYRRIPQEVKIQLRRRDFIVKKLIHRIPDRTDTLPIEML